MALADRANILDYIAQDNPAAAIELDDAFETKAEMARQRPTLYRTGRVRGTREIVVRPNYVMVYRTRATRWLCCAYFTPRDSGQRRACRLGLASAKKGRLRRLIKHRPSVSTALQSPFAGHAGLAASQKNRRDR